MLLLAVLPDEAAAQADEAIAQIKISCKNPDVKARVDAVTSLGKVQHAKTARILAGLLTTDDAVVRRKSAELLGQWASKQAEISAVLQAAVKPNSREALVLAALFDSMGNLKDKSAVDEVNNHLNDQNDQVSVAAIRASGKLGSSRSIDRLIGMWVAVDEYLHPHPTSDGKLVSPKRTPEMDRRYGMQEPDFKTALNAKTSKPFANRYDARTWWNANRKTFHP